MKPLLIPKMRVLMQMCCAAKQRRNMPANPPTRLFPVTIITGFTAALPHSRRPPLFFHIHPHCICALGPFGGQFCGCLRCGFDRGSSLGGVGRRCGLWRRLGGCRHLVRREFK